MDQNSTESARTPDICSGVHHVSLCRPTHLIVTSVAVPAPVRRQGRNIAVGIPGEGAKNAAARRMRQLDSMIVQIALSVIFVVVSSYTVGRMHQWYRHSSERD